MPLSEIFYMITETINNDLTGPVTEWEVKLALFTMHPEKSPGLDGMTDFLSKFLGYCKGRLTQMVNQLFFDVSMATGLNDTDICLIPKRTKPKEMSQFWPISLQC